jgi:hypothetical protein
MTDAMNTIRLFGIDQTSRLQLIFVLALYLLFARVRKLLKALKRVVIHIMPDDLTGLSFFDIPR